MVQVRSRSSPEHEFHMSFRPAGLEPLDASTLPIGVPSWVPMDAGDRARRFYFARLHQMGATPQNMVK